MESNKQSYTNQTRECNSTNFHRPDSTTDSVSWDTWGWPYLIATVPREKSIELVYRQDTNVTYSPELRPVEERIRIYKIVYSCKKGKWHISEPIEGKYVEAKEETYEF